MNRERLLERFLRYVRVETTADDNSAAAPTSPGQLQLGEMLAAELVAMGAADVEQTSQGIVYATVPATVEHAAPVVAFNSHLDTSPETTAHNVRPQIIEHYEGGDIHLPGDFRQVIRVSENPELEQLQGCTLITTDGGTLLGADDKAGVAVIMELAQHLLENTRIPHGAIRVLFTCDEEIGRGADSLDFEKLAADVAYTLDGAGASEIDTETFSADLAEITVHGVNIHPSIAKGRMVNALRAVAALVNRLPAEASPEQSEGRQGFYHPYDLSGGVAEAKLRVLLRDFDTARLGEMAANLVQWAKEVELTFPGCRIEVDVRKQYRNLGDALAREPRAVALAEEAHRRLGREPRRAIIRGGTDGALFSERGLPTPNLSTGQHNPHSPLEWACLDEMVQAVEVLVELVQLWGEQQK